MTCTCWQGPTECLPCRLPLCVECSQPIERRAWRAGNGRAEVGLWRHVRLAFHEAVHPDEVDV